MQENLNERVRLRQADLSEELTRQSHPVAVLPGLLRSLARPWPDTYELKDFKKSVFRWLTDLLHGFDEARSLRDNLTSTIAALEREREALQGKLTAGELENPDYDRDRERYHVKKTEIEVYQDALQRLDNELQAAEREWERVKPIVEREIERYADTLFMQEQRELQRELEEWQVKRQTVLSHAGTLNRWHVTLKEQYGLAITPRKVIFDPALPTAHSYSIEIEKEQVSHA